MAEKTRPTLKTYFESGDIPTQGNYTDLIDSQLNLKDGGTVAGATTFTLSVTASSNISASGDIINTGNISTDGNVTATHITASGNISASGTVYADNFTSTGADVSGVTFTDDINITGDITASGDISSSGTISGATATFTEYGNISASNSILTQHITASGNISSSGNVYASNIILHPSSSNNTGFIRPSVEGSRVVISPYNHGSEELLVIKANALEVKMDAFIAFMVNTSFAGHFNYGHKDLDFQYDYSDSTAGFIINNGDKTIYMSGSGLELGHGMHLTASGDISASGEIIGTINGGSF